MLRRISLSFNDLCRAVEHHLQTFSHRERKKVRKPVCLYINFLRFNYREESHSPVLVAVQMPDMLNWFGWCTWDAFYTNVTASDVKQGLQRYS